MRPRVVIVGAGFGGLAVARRRFLRLPEHGQFVTWRLPGGGRGRRDRSRVFRTDGREIVARARALGRRVVDRSQVILDIFADRTHTREAVLQVDADGPV